jgi:hypothetical protein
MTLERQSQTADYSRSGRSWFVSQSGSLPPSFSSLIRLNSTSGSRHSSKPHGRCTGRSCRFQHNDHPISRVRQKWKNCEGEILDESKARSLEQKQIAKSIFCDAARQQNYLFGIAKNLSHAQWRNISSDLNVWERKLKRKGRCMYEQDYRGNRPAHGTY